MLFIREDIPFKHLSPPLNVNIEIIIAEINFRKAKWLVLSIYNPDKRHLSFFIDQLVLCIDKFSSNYDNYLIFGDFNGETSEPRLKDFLDTYSLSSLISSPTCFKNPDNPSCIDLILTNFPKKFQHSILVESGLSDFHKMTVTSLRISFRKQKPKIIRYSDYNKFDSNNFIMRINNILSTYSLDDIDYTFFIELSKNIFNTMVPTKKRHIRYNQAPIMTKETKQSYYDTL